MKTFIKNIFLLFVMVGAVACNEGIDPVTPVAQGTDEIAPEIIINSPVNGTRIKLQNNKEWKIDIEVIDDIELKSISFLLDGNEIAQLTDFIDYRRYALPYVYEGITDGNHTLQIVATDLTGKETISSEVNFDFLWIEEFTPQFDEVFYLSFKDSYRDFASYEEPEVVGDPSMVDGKVGQAYKGAADSYLKFPAGLLPKETISFAFWYNFDRSQERSGVLTVSPQGTIERSKGFRLFREGFSNVTMNIGNGDFDSWYGMGALPETNDGWNHIAFTIAANKFIAYIDGNEAINADFAGPLNWDDCDFLSFASGQPYFVEWSHLADTGLFDEVFVFDRELSADDVQAIIALAKK